MFTQCGEQPGCILACIYYDGSNFFFRETTVKSSPSVSVRSPMPSALTTRALARIGPAAFVLLASELLSSAELSSSIAERVSSFTAAGGCCVAGSLSLAGALLLPLTCLEQEKSWSAFACLSSLSKERETLLQVLPSFKLRKAQKILADIELTDQTIAVYQQIVRPHDIHDPHTIGEALAKVKKTKINLRPIKEKLAKTSLISPLKQQGDYIQLFRKTEEEKGNLTKFLELDKNYQFYVTQAKLNKPLKVVLKGLPRVTLPEDIQIDLEALGYTIISCSQLISKRTKLELPFFLVTLPRNDKSSTIFDLIHLGYLQVRVEGYSINGVTQCYKCNNFFHTAANCFMKPRCLKCGKEHTTKECDITSRLENPYCINCLQYGHSACYTKCPKFPKPNKGAPILNRNKLNTNFNNSKVVEGLSFANVLSGNTPPSNPPKLSIPRKVKAPPNLIIIRKIM
ncbi:nucleic-acid-binding protein from transposon X-element [Trichonephila clavipes]|nr:nucleic-acid-binding protein from transposon X-element [Trichonephila clavipes]